MTNNVNNDGYRWITLRDVVTNMILGIYWARSEAEAKTMYKKEQVFEA